MTVEKAGLRRVSKKASTSRELLSIPDNSDVVWVAAQGPLWSPGGQRGIYKTTDGGMTWTQTLGDDEWVGATDLVIDPRNPEVLYAATWQRHRTRTFAAYLGGGPGSGLYKSVGRRDNLGTRLKRVFHLRISARLDLQFPATTLTTSMPPLS